MTTLYNTNNRYQLHADFAVTYNQSLEFLRSKEQCTKLDKWFKKLSFQTKSTELSKKFRTAGNDLYRQKKFQDAVEQFNQAIRYGRIDDMGDGSSTAKANTLSLAYYNRAISFMYLYKFKECVSDCDMAVESGYPANMQHKLYLTKAQACASLIRTDEALACLELAGKFVEHVSDLDPETKKEQLREIQEKMTKLKVRKDETAKPILLDGEDLSKEEVFKRKIVEVMKNKKPNVEPFFQVLNRMATGWKEHLEGIVDSLPTPDEKRIWTGEKFMDLCECSDSQSKCNDTYCVFNKNVLIKNTPEKGRGLFAKHAMKAGDKVFIDRSWASIPGRSLCNDVCHYCMMKLRPAFICCKYCSEVFFCNKRCSDEAWEGFHRFECGITSHLEKEGNYARMAYRMMVQTPWKHIRDVIQDSIATLVAEYKNCKDSDRGTMPGFKDGVYSAQDYVFVYHLNTNLDKSMLRDPLAEVEAISIAYKLLRLYEYKCSKLDVPKEYPDLNVSALMDVFSVMIFDSYDNRVLQLAVLLRHYLQCLHYNMFRLPPPESGFFETPKSADDFDHSGWSARLFPIAALMNHACEHNLELSPQFYGTTIMYRCHRDIAAGEELTTHYANGAMYFICKCPRCTDLKNFEYPQRVLFCEFCCTRLPRMSSAKSYMCSSCSQTKSSDQTNKVRKALEEYGRGYQMMMTGNFRSCKTVYERCQDLRLSAPIDSFSCILFMTRMSLSFVHAELKETKDHLRYAKLQVECYDKYPQLHSAYGFKDSALLCWARALEVECETAYKKRHIKQAQAFAAEIRGIFERCLREFGTPSSNLVGIIENLKMLKLL